MATDHRVREAHATEAAARGSDDADVRVTVVVPVWRPGEAIDPLIASLDAQTLSADRFELLLCDDGSGTETEERLRAIADARPNVRVLALPHSGWPGTPRNRGVEEARGRYVQFVDQDDHLFPEALERLVDYADEHGADVVVGKEVGVGRDIPGRIFRRDVPDARLGRDPLLQMLTPHKMFRTAFLREHGIRFPDGKVRLEDHLFVMQAYFAARRISILASTPCYAWLRQPGSASSSRIDPESYFPHLETVLDVVEANTEPGELRDGLLRHWLRGKILQRLSGRQMTRYPDEYRERLLDVVTPLVERRFGPGVDAGLAYPHRLRVALLREGRRDDLLTLARFEQSIGAAATIERATWSRGGGLALRLRLRLDGEETWTGPAWLDALHARVTSEPVDDRLEILARHDDDPATDVRIASGRIDGAGVAQVAIDPLRAFAADDEARRVALVVRAQRAGWPLEATLGASAALLAAVPASPLLAGRAVRLEQDDAGHVALRRRWPEGRMRDAAGRAARRVRRRLRRRA
ncbi:glycosyltransferase family 2 protein [Agrococcus sp. SGAir0287]|uniref:glycosyltransferase family 2 protein n=1 Tax=Agrococcus sp. SGAir0287 TaxID=2070347 RepID=UPI001585D605|nr:glycosyltransferase [Agrococcus sp. SGAir0287]